MPDSIESLVKYHRDAHYVNISADNYGETDKELLVKKLHEELFRLSINSYTVHLQAPRWRLCKRTVRES